jgi:hypothetical protein
LLSQIAAGVQLKPVTARAFHRSDWNSSFSGSVSTSSSLSSSPVRQLAASAAALGYSVNFGDSSAQPPPPPPPPETDGDQADYGVKSVVALYDHKGEDEHELSFVEGEVVLVLEEDASGWWLGMIGDRKGYFPSNYAMPVAQPAAPAASRTLGDIANEVPLVDQHAFRAAYKYVAMEPGEVSFSPGDDVTVTAKEGDWWVGTVNGVSGRFPAIMVEPAPVSVADGQFDTILEQLDVLTSALEVNLAKPKRLRSSLEPTTDGAAAASSSTAVSSSTAASSSTVPPRRMARSASLDVVRRPTVFATSTTSTTLPPGAVAVPPPMPLGVIRPMRIKTESQSAYETLSNAVRQRGDGLPVDQQPTRNVRFATTALPAPPPQAAVDETVEPLDDETQRKYDHDAIVRPWFRLAALQTVGGRGLCRLCRCRRARRARRALLGVGQLAAAVLGRAQVRLHGERRGAASRQRQFVRLPTRQDSRALVAAAGGLQSAARTGDARDRRAHVRS